MSLRNNINFLIWCCKPDRSKVDKILWWSLFCIASAESLIMHTQMFLSDWQSQCLEDIMVAQTKMLPVRGRWNDDRRLCTTWSFSAAYMKDCFYEDCFIFNFFPSCWKKMELLYISNDGRCNNWLRILETYVSTLLPAILYAVTIFSVSVFFLLTCFDWWWPCHYLSNS